MFLYCKDYTLNYSIRSYLVDKIGGIITFIKFHTLSLELEDKGKPINGTI